MHLASIMERITRKAQYLLILFGRFTAMRVTITLSIRTAMTVLSAWQQCFGLGFLRRYERTDSDQKMRQVQRMAAWSFTMALLGPMIFECLKCPRIKS